MLRRLLVVALLALTQAVVAAAAVTSPAAAATRPTIYVSDTVVTLGTAVTVSGETPALLQTVRLELLTAENGWQELARTISTVSGGYAFKAPAWYGAHQLRVSASATVLAPPSVSDVVKVTVKTAWRPKGKSSSWRWISHQGARWDPCETISYQINPSGGYSGSTADITAAFRKVGQVTGFRFAYAGTTSGTVRRGESGQHPPEADVLIDWQKPGQDPELAGTVAGIGGHWVLNGRRFDGYVVLDQSQRLQRATWRKVLAHELGHVVGLGHTTAKDQVMYGGVSSSVSTKWGKGDLAGLRRVGASQGCLKRQASTRGPDVAESVSLPVDLSAALRR